MSVNRTDEWRNGIEARLWLSEAPHLIWADQNMDSRTMKPIWQVLSSDEVDRFIRLFVERSLHWKNQRILLTHVIAVWCVKIYHSSNLPLLLFVSWPESFIFIFSHQIGSCHTENKDFCTPLLHPSHWFQSVAPVFVYLPGLPTGDLWPQETQLRGREKCSGDRPSRGRQSGFILRLALSASPALLKRTGPLNIPCKAFPGSSGLGRCSHRLGRRPMTWLPTSTESIFKVNYRVQCL